MANARRAAAARLNPRMASVDAFDAGGVALLRGLVDAATLARWRPLIDRRYERAAALGDGDADFNPYSASMRLAAVDGLDGDAVTRSVWRGGLRRLCEQVLGPRLACNLDQCWVRRQYASAASPPLHAPHAWHQDGALRADFGAAPTLPEPLPMLTCWIALTPCGVLAPGLQWVAEPLPQLLLPVELSAAQVRERFAAERWRQPALAAGDALLLHGSTLHRTHVTAAMTATRTSLELRLFSADRLPARLAGDRFIDLAVSP